MRIQLNELWPGYFRAIKLRIHLNLSNAPLFLAVQFSEAVTWPPLGAQLRAMRLIPLVGGLLSCSSLILLAVGMATDHWLNFFGGTSLNPTILNDALKQQVRSGTISDFTTQIEYNVKHFGLWVGCYEERSNATRSCAFVRLRCQTNVCWIRDSVDTRQETCKDTKMTPLTNCSAFQVVRAVICFGIFILVLGTASQIVSLLTNNRTLAAVAGMVIFLAGLIAMAGFSIFYSEEYIQNGVKSIANVGYSLLLVAIAWPLALLAGILSCCAASLGIHKYAKSDYSSSNF